LARLNLVTATSPTMTSPIERRDFLGMTMSGAVAAGLGITNTTRPPRVVAPPGVTFPRQDPAMVQEVVGASHRDLARVKQLVEARPALARAAVDWGFGDWEDALGAASHTGRYEIADLLIKYGARPTIFSAAMMGQLETVKAFIATSPGVQRVLGPHSITLLSHARAGGDRARAVRDYLELLGDADIAPPSVPLEAALKAAYIGSYSFGAAAEERLDVTDGPQGLAITRPGLPFARALKHVGNHEFFPPGAEAVRVRFSVADGKATSLTVLDADVVVNAMRTA
jgi:hypothetical protein